ncbi:membrane-associated progesterone-binding protein 4 [Rhypophila decipiens]
MAEPTTRRRKPDAQLHPRITELSDSEDLPSGDDISQTKPARTRAKIDDEDRTTTGSILVDILRVITFLFLASSSLSYLISGGESFFWGMTNPPNYLKTTWWKSKFNGPLYLTPAELSQYDGTDPTKPIYLAINGTIYDVSSNARTYGPGGSYHWFAGCDASRAYVTGCFAEDRTPDMRGVEEMYLPIDDPKIDKFWTKEEFEAMREKELQEALQKVHDGLDHWVKFFKNSKKYAFVGYVKRPQGWPGTEPRRKLCSEAAKGRKRREIPKEGDGK